MIRNNIAIDYLRAFITMLVLAHHSIIAYSNLPVYAIKSFAASSSIAPSATMAFISKPYLWSAFPVVDGQHWQGFDVLILFNDIFFMSLMFFLAGLFVWPSIARKGGRGYLYGRIRRLGLPFLLAAAFLSPLAYYPSYLLSGADPAAGAYFQQWFSLDYWPPGPCWFVAVLLGFDIVATILIKFFPGWIKKLGELCSGATHRPTRFFFGLIGISIVAYATMRLPFGANRWFTVGPLALQASRAFLYPTYFFAGLGVGVWGIERGLLARDGELQRRWPVWLGATVFAFVLCVFFVIQVVALGSAASFGLQGMSSVAFVVSCGTTSFLLLAVFVRFANRRIGILDSLSANAYGIYLVHYVFVTWIQYELVGANLSAIQKAATVFLATLLLSWGTVAGIRLIPFVGGILTSGARSSSTGVA